MNVWRIALKELYSLRDVKMMVFMIATPVALILILGTALSNTFNGSLTVGDVRVLYTDASTGSDIAKYWDSFKKQAGESGIRFEQAAGDTDGMVEVANNRYDGYVEMSDSGIKYYGNSRGSIESDIAKGAVAAFADRYKLVAEAAKTEPGHADEIMSGSGRADYVRETSLNASRKPGAMDYYAIAVTTMIIMYGALTAAELINTERKRNTAARLLASPVTKIDIFAGKIVGNLVQNMIFIAVVVLISKYMFNAYWGHNLGLVFLVLCTEMIFTLGLGLGIGYIVKGNASGTVVMMIIQFAALFGGSYFPVEVASGFMETISYYSPLRWSNDAILQIIYADNVSAVVSAVLLNVGFAVLLLGAAVFVMRRREGL